LTITDSILAVALAVVDAVLSVTLAITPAVSPVTAAVGEAVLQLIAPLLRRIRPIRSSFAATVSNALIPPFAKSR
jgi:hypothetical protein